MDTASRWGRGGRHDDPERARAHILRATYEVLREQGVDRATIAEIARQAKVSRATIYRYFEGSEAIIAALLARWQERLFRDMEDATRHYRDNFPELVRQCLHFAGEYGREESESFDIVSGPDPRKIHPFMRPQANLAAWTRILKEPCRQFCRETGQRIDLPALAGFLGYLVLLLRIYRIPRDELDRQLNAFWALGKAPLNASARPDQKSRRTSRP